MDYHPTTGRSRKTLSSFILQKLEYFWQLGQMSQSDLNSTEDFFRSFQTGLTEFNRNLLSYNSGHLKQSSLL